MGRGAKGTGSADQIPPPQRRNPSRNGTNHEGGPPFAGGRDNPANLPNAAADTDGGKRGPPPSIATGPNSHPQRAQKAIMGPMAAGGDSSEATTKKAEVGNGWGEAKPPAKGGPPLVEWGTIRRPRFAWRRSDKPPD